MSDVVMQVNFDVIQVNMSAVVMQVNFNVVIQVNMSCGGADEVQMPDVVMQVNMSDVVVQVNMSDAVMQVNMSDVMMQVNMSDVVMQVNMSDVMQVNMSDAVLQVNMSAVVEDINDKHMGPWADACQQDNIANTPLTPFIDQVLTAPPGQGSQMQLVGREGGLLCVTVCRGSAGESWWCCVRWVGWSV